MENLTISVTVPKPAEKCQDPKSGVDILEAKAFARMCVGNCTVKPEVDQNKNLKLLLTSSGLMPESAPGQKDAYRRMKSTLNNKRGVLYLLDAKLLTLQFRFRNDPKKVHDCIMKTQAGSPQQRACDTWSAYRRWPDEPGGIPVNGWDGEPVWKNESELLRDGFAGAEISLRELGHYSNGHLSILADDGDPIYLSYLWNYIVDDKRKYKIFLAHGECRNGKFIAKSWSGGEFSEEAWSVGLHLYNGAADDFVKVVTPVEFAAIPESVSTIWSCGGDTFMTVLNLCPYLHDSSGRLLNTPNVYARAILDPVKNGETIYIGQSAGTVALSYALGNQTIDDATPVLIDDSLELRQFLLDSRGLGDEWLFPNIGTYLGIPYGLVLRPHLKLDPGCRITKNVENLARLEQSQELRTKGKDLELWAVIMADYDFHKGQGDLLQLFEGEVTYLVGVAGSATSSNGCGVISDSRLVQPQLKGEYSFHWTPAVGEVFAAGPCAALPFRVFSSFQGPVAGVPPFPRVAFNDFSLNKLSMPYDLLIAALGCLLAIAMLLLCREYRRKGARDKSKPSCHIEEIEETDEESSS